MSVYSELLRMALAHEPPADQPVGDLVSRALSLRPSREGAATSADLIAEWLAYDVALVRLCEHLGVDHGMLDGEAGPASRTRAETLLAARMPSLTDALGVG